MEREGEGEKDEGEGPRAPPLRAREADRRGEVQKREVRAERDDRSAPPVPRVRIRPQPIARLPGEKPRRADRAGEPFVEGRRKESAREASGRSANLRRQRLDELDPAAFEGGGGRGELLARLRGGEPEGGVGVAPVEDVAGAVVDEDELPEDERVAHDPGRKRETEAEQGGERDVGSRAPRVTAVEEGSEEKRHEDESRGARQRRQREKGAGAQGEVGGRAVGGREQDIPGREEQQQEQGLGLDVGGGEDERRMEGRDCARHGGDGAPAKEARREGGEEDGRERAGDRAPDLRGGDPVGPAERDRGEKDGVARRPKEVGVGSPRVVARLDEGARAEEVGRRIREAHRRKADRPRGREASHEGEEKYRRADTASEPGNFRGATRDQTLPSRASS